jgi:hypothetical protein
MRCLPRDTPLRNSSTYAWIAENEVTEFVVGISIEYIIRWEKHGNLLRLYKH